LQHCHHIVTVDDAIEYDPMIAGVAAKFIREADLMNGHQFGQLYVEPVSMNSMSDNEKKKAREALMFLTEKRDGTIEDQMSYKMLDTALLWYWKFRYDLESIGFVFNPYDPYVANREIKGSQQTVSFYVDDLKSSHVLARIDDLFTIWLNKLYELYDPHGEITVTRGTSHVYFEMRFDYSVQGQVTIDMVDLMTKAFVEFPFELSKSMPIPADENIFQLDDWSPLLDQERAEIFHMFVAKVLFAWKRSSYDFQVAVAMLYTRAKSATEENWKKLLRMLQWVKSSLKVLILHAALVGFDDGNNLVLWTKLFLVAEGYEVKVNTVYQDNQSSILLEVHDQVETGDISAEYCPTKLMVADFFTMPLQGEAFLKFKRFIMGID
jgi:hypothetical protein